MAAFEDSASVGFALDLSELMKESTRSRAVLQNNEDKIEEFNKWSESIVRFVRVILEDAARLAQSLPNLDIQIGKFANFQDSFGAHRTCESLETISNLLRNTQHSQYKLINEMSGRVVAPLQNYFQGDFRDLKESRKNFDKTFERYESVLMRYYSLSKFKDVADLDEDLVQLYETRVNYLEQCFDHATKINNFKEVIDILFLEKIIFIIEDLSEFFQTLSDSFTAVKIQLDNVRGEFDRLNRSCNDNCAKNERTRQEFIEKSREKWNPDASIVRNLTAEKSGNLLMKRRKTLGTPWKRVFATISSGQFILEGPGRIRGTLEQFEKLNVLLCEVRPVDFNDRRFCFELYTGQQGHLFQAESEDEMMDWINSFHAAKSEMVQRSKSATKSPQSEPPPVDAELAGKERISESFDFGSNSLLKKWNQDARKNFDLSIEGEIVLCCFPASLHTDIWTQGQVFVTQFTLYFYSSLFGIGSKIIVPLRDVVKIDVVQTSFVTLVNFTLTGDAKDLTLKTFNTVDGSNERLIDNLQLLHRNTQSAEPLGAPRLLREMQQLESDEFVTTLTSDYINNNSALIDTSAAAKPSPPNFIKDLEVASAAENEETESTRATAQPLPTKEVSCACSNHMDKRQVNTVFPIDCALAFELMFGPDCPIQHAVQARRKNRRYKITGWKVNDGGVEERSESYLFPINNPLVRIKETECYVTIKLSKKIPGRCYVVDLEARTPNIMYADAFYTKTRYCITWAGPDQTRISICLGIVWLKSPFIKSIIKSVTMKTFTEFCVDYVQCLRQDISQRIGGGLVGERSGNAFATAENQTPTSETDQLLMNKSSESTTEPSDGAGLLRKIFDKDILESLMRVLSNNYTSILPIIIAIVISFMVGCVWKSRAQAPQVTFSSSDLEAKVLKDLHLNSDAFLSLTSYRLPSTSRRQWFSSKFQQSHFQLETLHSDFVLIRQGISEMLDRLNALERRIYTAQMAAVLADGLLSCLAVKDETERCRTLQSKWNELTAR